MKRLLLVTLLIWASACGKSYSPSPVAPTPAQTPALPPHSMLPAPIVSMGSIPAHPVQNQGTTFRLAFSVKNGVIAKSVLAFGDGSQVDLGAMSGDDITVDHVYTTAGTFVVSLTVSTTDGGTATLSTPISVSDQ